MAKIDIINIKKDKVGSMDLADSIFGAEVNTVLVHQVMKALRANARQGTAKTKTKSEVRGGGRKPFRQKGTGNARQGSTRSPLHPGGGQNFGPVPRSYRQFTNKKMMHGALRSILSDRVKSERFYVLDELTLKEPKTKLAFDVVNKQLELKKVLFVDEANPNWERASKNLPFVKTARPQNLNVLDVLASQWVVMTQRGVETLTKRLTEGGKKS